MKIKSLFIQSLLLLFAFLIMPVMAQDTAAVEADDSATTKSEDPLAAITNVFGESGMELMAGNDELEGNIEYLMSEAGDLLGLEATNAVIMKSEKLDLECDYLRIDSLNEKITATGNVHLRIQDRKAICGRFEYDIAKRQSILTEEPRIIDSDENNKSPFSVNACVIIISEDENGETKTIMRSCPGDDKKVKIKINRNEDEPPLIEEESETGAQQINLNNPDDVGRVIGNQPASAPGAKPAAPESKPNASGTTTNNNAVSVKVGPKAAEPETKQKAPDTATNESAVKVMVDPSADKKSDKTGEEKAGEGKKKEEKKEESKDLGIM